MSFYHYTHGYYPSHYLPDLSLLIVSIPSTINLTIAPRRINSVLGGYLYMTKLTPAVQQSSHCWPNNAEQSTTWTTSGVKNSLRILAEHYCEIVLAYTPKVSASTDVTLPYTRLPCASYFKGTCRSLFRVSSLICIERSVLILAIVLYTRLISRSLSR
jgi:hypothetical protein